MAEEREKTSAQADKTEEAEASLLDTILEATKIKPSDEGYGTTKQGVEALLSELLTPKREGVKVQTGVVNEMIAEIDRKLSSQLDTILHNPTFQNLNPLGQA